MLTAGGIRSLCYTCFVYIYIALVLTTWSKNVGIAFLQHVPPLAIGEILVQHKQTTRTQSTRHILMV